MHTHRRMHAWAASSCATPRCNHQIQTSISSARNNRFTPFFARHEAQAWQSTWKTPEERPCLNFFEAVLNWSFEMKNQYMFFSKRPCLDSVFCWINCSCTLKLFGIGISKKRKEEYKNWWKNKEKKNKHEGKRLRTEAVMNRCYKRIDILSCN